MHDIDRTQMEGAWEAAGYGNGEFEEEFDGYGELYGETFDDEFEYDGEYEYDDEYEVQGPLDEADEMELAAELLEITDEYELDQFLGKIFKKVTRSVGRVLPKAVRAPLGNALRGLAKKALPVAGAALGNLAVPGSRQPLAACWLAGR